MSVQVKVQTPDSRSRQEAMNRLPAILLGMRKYDLYCWDTLVAAFRGLLRGEPKIVEALCDECRFHLKACGLALPMETASGR